jgi:hypothetical protein
MSDVTKALAAKSDQLNADDLIAGPITIKITSVKVDNSAEQKITVNFENDNKKPWKPCKTAGRCLSAIWGPDSSKWIGLKCTIYRDDTVTWAGAIVGGIRVSHVDGLDKPRVLNLSKTRGKKSQFVILPLSDVINTNQKAFDTEYYLKKIQDQTSSEELKEVWWQVKKICMDDQDYQALEKLKIAATEKAAQLKQGNDNA